MKCTPYQQELNELHKRINDLEKKLTNVCLLLSDRVHLLEVQTVKHDVLNCEIKNLLDNY